jgi:hypothetical protein
MTPTSSYAAQGLLLVSSRSSGSASVASPALPGSPITRVWKGFCGADGCRGLVKVA